MIEEVSLSHVSRTVSQWGAAFKLLSKNIDISVTKRTRFPGVKEYFGILGKAHVLFLAGS